MVHYTNPHLDAAFAALADVTRRGVLERLGRGEASISDLAEKFDMTLMRAAKSLGASSWYAYRNVMFPILKPAVVSGLLFAFVTSFDEIIIVLFLAGPDHITLPIRLFEGIRDELTPVVISAAMVMVLISVGSMGLIEWVRRRSEAAKEA